MGRKWVRKAGTGKGEREGRARGREMADYFYGGY